MSHDNPRGRGARRVVRAVRGAPVDERALPPDDDSVVEESPGVRSGVREWFDGQVSWLSSSVVHVIALLVLALVPLLPQDKAFVATVTSTVVPPEVPIEEVRLPEFVAEVPELKDELPDLPLPTLPDRLVRENFDLEPNYGPLGGCEGQEPPPIPYPEGPPKRWRIRPGTRGISDKDGAGTLPRGDLNTIGGPTEASETAVTAALNWLAAHQLPDGSWSFDHRDGVCNGRCKNHGQFKEAKNAATALALLTFLGAGETHLAGKHRPTVDGGLRYLLATQKIAGTTGSWHEKVGNSGNYSHAIATLAVCEALEMSRMPLRRPVKSPSEMTEEERRQWKEERERAKRRGTDAVTEKRLAAASQAAINYIIDGQHKDGGWRYDNGQAGDTSVVGWMLMAMKSGYLAKVRLSKNTVTGASRFLDSVQNGDYGSIYHYMPDKSRPEDALRATTAIGLLCRMYLGWDRNHPGIAEGVALLGRWQPSTGERTNMYYNYYATQVMHHYGGRSWRDWNRVMRDYLVKTQAKNGHEHGSWHFTGDHGATAGGRLYFTTLSAMTLEVYYRYLPIYRGTSVEDDLQFSPR